MGVAEGAGESLADTFLGLAHLVCLTCVACLTCSDDDPARRAEAAVFCTRTPTSRTARLLRPVTVA